MIGTSIVSATASPIRSARALDPGAIESPTLAQRIAVAC
jgi:hypothetical protein